MWPRRIKNADIAGYLHLDSSIHAGGGGALDAQLVRAQNSAGTERRF
jgi:hypothetical protein